MRAVEIQGFPGYRITADGRVQSQWRRRTRSAEWRDLRASPDANGYLGLTLCAGTIRRKFRIHRLVAAAFVNRPYGAQCVRHLDGNRQNNRVANIRWGTYKQNEADKRRHGTWNTRYSGKLSAISRKVAAEMYRKGERQADIARYLGVSRPTITRLLNGSTWSGMCAS